MKLYCVRHAEAKAADVDPQRPLTDKGQADVTKVGIYLENYDLHIRHILHSEKLRAKQTAGILAKHLNIEELTECPSILAGDAELDAALEMIKTLSEDTMVVGHLPFMAKFISQLVIGNQDYYPIVTYPPGCIVCLNHYDHERWVIDWIIRPSIVAEKGN